MVAFESLPLLVFFGAALTLLVVRYALFTTGAWFGVSRLFRRRFAHRKIQPAAPPAASIRREILYSLSSTVIFAGAALAIRAGVQSNLAPLYDDVSTYGWAWTIASLGLLMVLHDAYFWMSHRLLHTKWLFKHVHVVHHRSVNPTPFAAFAFHPVEAVVQAAFVVLVAYALPLHVVVLTLFVNISLGINVLGHLGHEFYPAGMPRNRLLRFLTTSTHHNLHHQRTHGNYGLYFTWWDMAAKTMRSDYEETFAAVVARPRVDVEPTVTVASHPALGVG